MKKLLTKTDLWILCGALLLLAAAFLLFYVPARRTANTVNIYVDGALYASVPLQEARDVLILRGEKRNVVSVDEAGVWMAEASCPDHTCVKQGKLTPENMNLRALGNRIICLPNRVTVELVYAP